jgi:hypothetical protein
MKTELFKKVYIKSEADLPKEGSYIAHFTSDSVEFLSCEIISVIYRIRSKVTKITIDWYLQPIEIPSDEEIKLACPQTLISRISCWIQGAKWLKSKIQ